MVYCGHASKGCATCRAKRTKCDQVVPYCGQCVRANRVCPGYRDQQNLSFRNETEKVVNKARTARAFKARESNSLVSKGSKRSASPHLATASTETVARNFSTPLEEQGICSFMHHLFLHGTTIACAHLDYLPGMYKAEPVDSPLSLTVKSIGMALISNTGHAPEVMLAARKIYARTLQSVATKLQDPMEARRDETLMAVMLMGIFENVTCATPQSMKSWTSHVTGATAIARLRGPDQLKSPVGYFMFKYLRMLVLSNCLQRMQCMPPEIIDLSQKAMEVDRSIDSVPDQQIFQIIIRLCDLRHTWNTEMRDDPTTFSRGLTIDTELDEWVNQLPLEYAYLTKKDLDNPNTFQGIYHVYKGIWCVGAWNVYRVARIFNTEMIRSWLRRNTPPSQDPQTEQYDLQLVNLASDVCAGTPCLLDVVTSKSMGIQSPRAAIGISLLWPLYIAANCDIPVPGLRPWVVTQLERIGHDMGIQQALSLARLLRVGGDPQFWERMTRPGADMNRLEEETDEWG